MPTRLSNGDPDSVARVLVAQSSMELRNRNPVGAFTGGWITELPGTEIDV